MKKLLILGINLFALSFILCLISCEQAQNTAAGTQQAAANTQTVKQPIKTAKKRNCSEKQTFEGVRGGVYHIDTAKNGNVYKHYVKQ